MSEIPRFEYGFIVKTIEPRGALEGIEEVLGVQLAEFTEPLAQTLRTLDRGGWEAVSHSLLSLPGQIVVTVMIRRPYENTSEYCG